MAKKGTKALLVIGSFVVIGGVLAYFLFFRTRKKGTEGTGETPPTTGESSAYTPTTSGGTSGSSSSSFTFPFKTTEEGNKFRKWVNDNYPQWAKDNELGVSGKLNSYVEKAWKQYGDVYNRYVLNPSSSSTPTTGGTSSEDRKIEIRLKNGSKVYKTADTSPSQWLVEFGSGSDALKLSWNVSSSNMRVSPQGHNMFKISIPKGGNIRQDYSGWVRLRDVNWKYI